MRRLLPLVLMLVLTVPLSAQERNEYWRWILTEAVGDHWETMQGVGEVEISGRQLHVRLRDSEKNVDDRFDIIGTIDVGGLGLNRRGIQEGKIRVIVTRLASDIRPSEFVGTYWKAVLTPRLIESFGTEFTEIIVLSDPVSTISLLKETKAQTTPASPPN
jgi:hypothetical protein